MVLPVYGLISYHRLDGLTSVWFDQLRGLARYHRFAGWFDHGDCCNVSSLGDAPPLFEAAVSCRWCTASRTVGCAPSYSRPGWGRNGPWPQSTRAAALTERGA